MRCPRTLHLTPADAANGLLIVRPTRPARTIYNMYNTRTTVQQYLLFGVTSHRDVFFFSLFVSRDYIFELAYVRRREGRRREKRRERCTLFDERRQWWARASINYIRIHIGIYTIRSYTNEQRCTHVHKKSADTVCWPLTMQIGLGYLCVSSVRKPAAAPRSCTLYILCARV